MMLGRLLVLISVAVIQMSLQLPLLNRSAGDNETASIKEQSASPNMVVSTHSADVEYSTATLEPTPFMEYAWENPQQDDVFDKFSLFQRRPNTYGSRPPVNGSTNLLVPDPTEGTTAAYDGPMIRLLGVLVGVPLIGYLVVLLSKQCSKDSDCIPNAPNQVRDEHIEMRELY